MDKRALDAAYAAALRFLGGVGERPVGASLDATTLRARLGGPLPDAGEPAARVVEDLAREADPGLVATAGPRFFGFVIGGSLPAAVGADWLTSAWDQNAGLFVLSPAASVVEETVLRWLTELLVLPAGTGAGFVTGGQMANTTCLAAARQSVLARAGWDVGARGLGGAPQLAVLAGDEAHITVYGALRLLGLGDASVVKIASDGQGRMQPEALGDALRSRKGQPVIICAQAGNVNTGAFDPLADVTRLAREHGAWVHVDGAFGLWAAASPATRHLVEGLEGADSWATDAHKWLNVPYDSGLAFVRDTAAHRAAMARSASYLQPSETDRDNYEWTPEFSRRARGFPVYAALRSLGRSGLSALIERCCAHARLFAGLLSAAPGVRVVNEVALNQVLVRFEPPSATPEEGDAWTREVIARVQRDGTCWLSGTVWRRRTLMRISVCNWSTTGDDVRRSAAAILAAHQRS
ncbi:MAG: pyridoxal phosphate-dependent decarboxylase family protein [Myxococcales bacterium]